MARKQKQTEEGLHAIENEKRPRVIKKKRGGIRLKSKYHRRITKVLASFSVAAVLTIGVFGVNALFFKESAPNVVDEGFVTVAYPLPEDGSTPDMHSALENIGYMNTRLMGQDNWYSEMRGVVDTMLQQQVSTFKQFSDDVLIQTDITTSSMVNSARQFCYVGDRVIWREAAGGASTYNGIDTPWKEGEPYANMLVDDFKKVNGLPGTSFSVYVINEETLLSADEVIDNGDGTYSQTYYLDPATDKAPAYYVNQMKSTGGLTSLPTFEYITVTYTFDATWQVLRSDIDEKYTATMGVSVGCSASYTTVYEYDTQKAVSDAYDTYFKNYADKPTSDVPPVQQITAANCLAGAFGPVMEGPVTFSLDLTIGKTPLKGLAHVDAAALMAGGDISDLVLRANFGNIFVGLEGGEVRLAYGNGVKGKADLAALTELLSSYLPAGDISLDTDALTEQLGAGELTVSEDGTRATLDSTLSLMGLELPLRFAFNIGENNAVSLDHIAAELSLDGTDVTVRAAFGEGDVALPAGDYVDLVPYAESVLAMIEGKQLTVGVNYTSEAFAVAGSLDIDFKDAFKLNGSLDLTVAGVTKRVDIAFDGTYAYVDLDGVKIKANAADAVALIMQLAGAELPSAELSLGLEDILSAVLSEDFASAIALSQEEGALRVALGADAVLKALGVQLSDLVLGNVTLGISADGTLTAEALGAVVTVTKGEEVVLSTEGYTDILPLAKELLAIFADGNIHADVSYRAGELAVSGEVALDLNAPAAAAAFTLTYRGKTQPLSVVYAQDTLALDLGGVRVKANVNEALALLSGIFELPQGGAEGELITQLLSLDLGEVISFEDEDSVLLRGTQLMQALGVDFALGDVNVTVAEGTLTVGVLDAVVTVTKGEAFTPSTEGYTDIIPYAEALKALLTDTQYFRAEVSYAADSLTVDGVLNFAITPFAVQGDVTLGYAGAAVDLSFGLRDGIVYLAVNGLKVKADAAEAIALVSELLGADLGALSEGERDILQMLFGLDLGSLVQFDDGDALTVVLKGTQLMQALGVDFALGDVNVTVAEGMLTAEALGAVVTVTKGEEVVLSTEGYTDILPLAGAVADLYAAGGISATLHYAQGGLTVDAPLSVSFAPFAVKGEATLTYTDAKGSAGKSLSFAYGEDGYVYLTLEGAKLKLHAADAVSLLSNVLGAAEDADAQQLLQKLLSLDFGEVIGFESESAVLVRTDALLKAFGVSFAAGDVRLTLENGTITADAAALGIRVDVRRGATFTVDGGAYADYADLTPVLDTVVTVLNEQKVALGGQLTLGMGGEKIALRVENGVVSWKEGLRLSLTLAVTVGDTRQEIEVYADEARIKIVYGNVGVDVKYNELTKIEAAFRSVYDRIADIVSRSVAGALPASSEELLSGMQAGEAVTKLLHALDLPQLIGGIAFGAPQNGGLFTLSYGKFAAEVALADGGLVVDVPAFSTGDLTVSGSLTAGKADAQVAYPQGEGYMTANDLAELLDFLGAAVATVASDDVAITFNDSNAVYTANGETKFDLRGGLAYHAGTKENGKPFVTVDTQKKTIEVNPAAYAYFSLWIDEKAADGTDLYLEFWMVEYQDAPYFFVSLSKYMPFLDGNGKPTLTDTGVKNAAYIPLNFAVAAKDVLTIAASGVTLLEGDLAAFLETLGLPETLIQTLLGAVEDYFVTPLLSDAERGQLGALGAALSKTLGLDELVAGLLGTADKAEMPALDSKAYLTELGITTENGETVFTVALDSDLIYGGEGLEDLTLKFRKTQDEAGESYLSGITLQNIHGTQNSIRTSVGFSVSRKPLTLLYTDSGASLTVPENAAGEEAVYELSYADFNNYIFAGADTLVKTLARSATHKTETGYALNDSFFISGTAALSIIGYNVNVTVNGLAVGIGENGEISLDASLSFPKVAPLLGAVTVIGEAGTTELSVRNGMVYMRRTLAGGSVEHRAVMLDEFFTDIMGHLAFALNLSDWIVDQMQGTEGSGTTDERDEKEDYGTILTNALSSYRYTAAAGTTGDAWELILNGPALTGDVLENIVITLQAGAYKEYGSVLRSLSVSTRIPLLGSLAVDISASLTFENPCGDWVNGEKTLEDLSEQIPDLYYVTIVSPAALSGWQETAAGYTRTVQMFLGSEVSLAYGDTVIPMGTVGKGENVFDFTDAVLPANADWSGARLIYTANTATLRVPLEYDHIVYKSTLPFTTGDHTDVTELTAEYDAQYSLLTPTAEGYTFLGWYVLENGTPKKVTELTYSGTGNAETVVQAMWAKNITVAVSGKEDYKGVYSNYSTTAEIVSGGELVGAYAEKLQVQVTTSYRFFLQGNSWTRENTQEFDGVHASASWEKSDMIWAQYFENTVTLTYRCVDASGALVTMGSVSATGRADL